MNKKVAKLPLTPRTNYCHVFSISENWFQQIGTGDGFPTEQSEMNLVLSCNFAPPGDLEKPKMFSRKFYEQKLRKKLRAHGMIDPAVRYLAITNFGTAFTFTGSKKP